MNDSTTSSHLKDLTLVGYVLAPSPELLKVSPQPERILKYCKKFNFNLIFMEKEAGQNITLSRPGLWTVARAMVCYSCAPRPMPLGIDTEAWLQDLVQPCQCDSPVSVDGLVVSDISVISSHPRNGAMFALYLARLDKHLIISEQDRCVSCCNPAVQPIISQDPKGRPDAS